MLSKTNMRRGAIRVAVAGALVTIPLAAVAATASAEAPADAAQVQQVSEGIALEGADVSRPHPGDGFPARPGPGGPRVEFRGPEHEFPGHGPRVLFREALPPTGSFGSS
ncbi:hypothetical protein [Nocardia amikacinitolerans]|uniref:hypothetical protein n=1 Tax=Nocardia amikacinitolerans TaxID=756689 RepID=UPI0020A2A247|nr:hypothetical protein [Nocardia amikacinitolerans]MCP2291317.1 hypothetical protein [Nocardia amikacinitolerans]